MSDSSSEEVVAAPKAKVKAAVVMDDSDSDDSKEVPKAGAPKMKAAAAAPAFETDSEDESAPARPAPKAKAVVDSDSSDGEQAPATIKIAQKAKVIQAGSDDSDDDSDAGVAPAKADKTAKAQKSEGKEPAKKSKGESKDADRSSMEKKGEKDVDGLRVYIAGLPWKVTEEELTKDFSKCGEIKNAKILTDDQERSKGMAFITFRTAEGTKRALARDGDSQKYPGRTIKVALANKTTGKDSKESKKESAEAQRKADRVNGLIDVSRLEEGDIFNHKIIKKMVHAMEQKDFAVLEQFGMNLASRARIAKGEKKKKQETQQKSTVFVKGLPTTDFDESAFRQRFEDCGKIKFLWMPRKRDGELKGFGTLMFKNDEAFQKALKYNGTKCKDNKLTVVPSKPKEERGEDDGKTPKKEKKQKEEKAAEAVEKTAKRKAGDEGEELQNDKQERKKQKLAQEIAEILPRKEKKSKATEAPVEEAVVKKKKKEAA